MKIRISCYACRKISTLHILSILKIRPTSQKEFIALPQHNMATPMKTYASSVFFSFTGICAFLLCVAMGTWGYKLWTTRGFYVKDFNRLSAEAREFAGETERLGREVEQDHSAELSVRMSNMELLAAADEWDTGICIALGAWEDIMQPHEGSGDVESANGDSMVKARRKSHRRHVIGLMRRKCMEGIERRKEFGPQLQRIYLEVNSR